MAATSSQPVEPARRFGRGKLDRGWPEWLVVLAERAGTMACRGKLDRGWPERLFVLAERAGTIGWSSWLVELARFAGRQTRECKLVAGQAEFANFVAKTKVRHIALHVE